MTREEQRQKIIKVVRGLFANDYEDANEAVDDLLTLFDQEKKAYALEIIGKDVNAIIPNPVSTGNGVTNIDLIKSVRNDLKDELRRKVQEEEK